MFIVNFWGHRCATAILTIRNNQPCRNSPWSSSTLALSQRHLDPLFPKRTFGYFYCLKRTSGSASNVPASPGLRMASFNGSESGSCFFSLTRSVTLSMSRLYLLMPSIQPSIHVGELTSGGRCGSLCSRIACICWWEVITLFLYAMPIIPFLVT